VLHQTPETALAGLADYRCAAGLARGEAQRLAEGLEKPIQVEETGKGYNGFTERAAEIELKKLQTARPEYDWEIKPAEHMDSHDITRGKYGIKGVLRESDARLDGPNQPARTYEVEGTVPKVKEELDLGDGSKLTSTTNGDTGVTTTERVAPDNTAERLQASSRYQLEATRQLPEQRSWLPHGQSAGERFSRLLG
jgi:hypothetical protein